MLLASAIRANSGPYLRSVAADAVLLPQRRVRRDPLRLAADQIRQRPGVEYRRGKSRGWGCLGRWYAGRWHTPAAAYIAHMQGRLTARDWAMPDFPWR